MKSDIKPTGINFSIILSVVTILFLIGLVIFIFVISMGELKTSVATEGTGSQTNNSIVFTDGAGNPVSATGDNIQLNNVVVTRCGV